MGNSDAAAIGGFSISFDSFSDPSSVFETGFFWLAGPNFKGREDKPDMTGGGSSIPSAAFLDNCLAKSDACHHSKNLSANILVGSSIFRLPSNLSPIILRLNMLVTPRLLPDAPAFGSSRAAIAL